MMKKSRGALGRIWMIALIGGMVLAFGASSIAPSPVAAQGPLPLADGHLHYTDSSSSMYSVAQVIALLNQAGVTRALTSSTPNERTLALYAADPVRFVPEVRPYRTITDKDTWFQDPTIITYVQQELTRGVYRGIGEFHVRGAEANTPVVDRIVDLSVEQKLLLHAHSDETAIATLFQHNPQAVVLWAHAGGSVPPTTLGQMLSRYPNLWIELSGRNDIEENGSLTASWRALFLQYPDRFIYGSDTWTQDRWSRVVKLADKAREWLGQLPPEVATQIASQNMERLLVRSQMR